MTALHDVDRKRFERDGELRVFPKGRFEVVQIGGLTIGRAIYEPGWRWSEDVGPAVGAPRCTVEHVGLVVSGAVAVEFDDDRVITLNAGELFYIPAIPHDSWVVGDQPYVSLHLLGAGEYSSRVPASSERDPGCFVCGWANRTSLGVTFQPVDDHVSRTHYVARRDHEGWPGVLHGGVLFALFDDAVGWAARYQGRPSVTSRASIRYRQPVPTDTALEITGSVRPRGRVLAASATASRTDGIIVAEFDALLFPRP